MNNVLALWCKEKEIEALDKASEYEDMPEYNHYWSGKAEAFSNVWEHIISNGKGLRPEAYNQANEHWSSMVPR